MRRGEVEEKEVGGRKVREKEEEEKNAVDRSTATTTAWKQNKCSLPLSLSVLGTGTHDYDPPHAGCLQSPQRVGDERRAGEREQQRRERRRRGRRRQTRGDAGDIAAAYRVQRVKRPGALPGEHDGRRGDRAHRRRGHVCGRANERDRTESSLSLNSLV